MVPDVDQLDEEGMTKAKFEAGKVGKRDSDESKESHSCQRTSMALFPCNCLEMQPLPRLDWLS